MKLLANIRSFIRRDRRLSPTRQRLLEKYRTQDCFTLNHYLDLNRFKAKRVVLEIGFGLGHALIQMASKFPDVLFLGVEVHLAGIARVLKEIETKQLTNLKLFECDAVTLLTQIIPENCLDKVQIFFPDPWHKRRHHKRRLINAAFLDLLALKLRDHGVLHIATDWGNYAKVIQNLMQSRSDYSQITQLSSNISEITFKRFPSKYEHRGQRLGHQIYDLVYALSPDPSSLMSINLSCRVMASARFVDQRLE